MTTKRYLAACLLLAACAGTDGKDGLNGADGTNGVNGVNGTDGVNGTNGASGVNGANGANGANGTNGVNGITTGTITGTLTFQPNLAASPLPAALPCSNVTVTDLSITDAVVSTTTDAAGTFTLSNIPAGIHSLSFSGNAYATLQVDGVSVLATKTTTLDRMLTATNPLILTPAVASAPAGFNAPVTLSLAIAGGTAPYTYRWVPAAANPTPVTLSSTTASAPTFTTGSLAAVMAGGKAIGFGAVTEFTSAGAPSNSSNPQIGFLGISAQQLAQMTWNFTVTVTDARGFVKAATVAVPPATLAQGNGLVPVGQMVIANLPGLTGDATLSVPGTSSATLHDPSTRNPWFVPDVKGNYTVTAGGRALTVNVATFTGSSTTCAVCHALLSQPRRDAIAGKFKDWGNSAHGNHFFKYMHYNPAGALVWNTDANGKAVPAPTANPSVFWSQPGAMTTFQFGLTGAEGTHYSASCTGCHTTGNNALANNGGFDDVARSASWVFPNLASTFTSLTGPTSVQVISNGALVTMAYDQVTASPVNTAWTAVPESVKALTGMQCESCHGPFGNHTVSLPLPDGGMAKPVAEFGVGACAGCHDKPGNHDRVSLWRQSRHATMSVALAEGAGVSSSGGAAAPRASCNRCHSAQGFVQYLSQLNGTLHQADGTPIVGSFPGNLIDPSTSPLSDAPVSYMQGLGITADAVQPVTCQTCHDPHTTGLRMEGETPLLPSGFRVSGAGTGAICFVCHNSRVGARGDQFNGVYTNNGNPGTPVTVTSIGAPHEAAQGDVVAGRNAFFVGTWNPSPHLSVQDACVGCHMKTFPAGLTGTNTNHTWHIDSTSCASCHGGSRSPVDGEALQHEFDSATQEVLATLTQVGQTTVRGLFYKGSSRTVQIPADAVAVFATGRAPGFVLTFSSAINDPNAASGTITSLGTTASPASLANLYTDSSATVNAFDVLRGTFAKANWNYELLVVDGSRGVHNPSFTFNVLSATVAALNGTATK